MDKVKMLELAKAHLNELDVNALESFHLDHTKYDDGSVSISIEMSYPATKNDIMEIQFYETSEK